ncbi:MAG TPA: TVP38/TMEM64 family protein [Gemmatimonadaceae bacterium]|nr:TVP38/TMEM64 family protein [Gemmatimonadaceae bacterium]
MKKADALRLAVPLTVLVLALALAWAKGWLDYQNAAKLIHELRAGHGRGTAAMIYVAAFATALTLGLPAAIGIIVGGALFGAVLGTVLSWAGAMLGAVAGYWLARLIGRDSLRSFFCRHRALDRMANEQGFWTMLRLRIVPVIPLAVLSFAAGLSRTSHTRYLAATAIGILPSMAVYSYFADSLLSGFGDARRDALVRLAIASAALLALSFLARRAGNGGQRQGQRRA